MQPNGSGRHSGEVWGTAALAPQTAGHDSSGIGRLSGAAPDLHFRLGTRQKERLSVNAGDHRQGVWDVGSATTPQDLIKSQDEKENFLFLSLQLSIE